MQKNINRSNKDENQCHHQYSTENNENELQLDFKRYTITGLSHEAYKKSRDTQMKKCLSNL